MSWQELLSLTLLRRVWIMAMWYLQALHGANQGKRGSSSSRAGMGIVSLRAGAALRLFNIVLNY